MRRIEFYKPFGRRLPVIFSAEGAECGLVCLAMVSGYFGRHETLNDLRQRFPISMSGVKLSDLMRFSDTLGFSSRALKINIEDLNRIVCPVVLHWGLNHFVVLKEIRRNLVTIHDPATGRQTIDIAEVSKLFTGVVLELSPAADFEPRSRPPRVELGRVLPNIPGLSGSIAQVLVLSLALQICALAIPLQIQLIVDQVISSLNGDLLLVISLGFGLLMLFQIAMEGLRGWILQVVGNQFSFQAVGNIFRHLLRLPTDFFEKRQVGDILSRLGSAAYLQDFLTKGVVSVILDGFMAIISIIMLIIYDQGMTAIVLVSVLINLAIARVFSTPVRRLGEERLRASAQEQSYLMETVRSASMIKMMGAEPEREARWRNLYARVLGVSQSSSGYQILSTALQGIVGSSQLILIIYLGSKKVLQAEGFSVGMLMAFLSFRQMFTDRTTALIFQFVQFRMLGLHLDRMSDIVNTQTEWSGHSSAVEEAACGTLSLHDVSFRYGISDRPVLENISLAIQPGEFLAIVGPTGGGKTTLLKLLVGLRQPIEGVILIDGVKPTAEMWRRWRSGIGFVAQDDCPLAGTIADNIAFFDPDMSMSRVVAAAKQARVHDEIMGAPMGYQTMIAESGSNLSGGQRQRLLLARALYRRPSTLIIDEGTANLDEATEGHIADLVSDLPMTRVVVAHRPALVARAGRVIRVERRQLHVVRETVAEAAAE